MAQQRYHLDARVLTAFFVAAMPFVAFGSFIVVNQARNLLRESAGASLEQRAVQTKLALEQYVADQVVHLRLVAMDPELHAPWRGPRPLSERTGARPSRPGPPARTPGSPPRSSTTRSPPALARSPRFDPLSARSRWWTPPAG
jgi:hypothetical protein